MASPFSVFRKNQKFLMAIACLLAIVAFVFLPMIGQNMGDRSGGPVNAVVVKTSQFGDKRESDIHNLLLEHRRVLAVLTDIAQLSGVYPAMANQMAKNAFLSPTEENVVDTWLLANHAQQMGMVVSDATINAFLKSWTRDAVKTGELAAALKRSGFTVIQFFDLMRNELMARQLREMFLPSLAGITPAERWEYFTRVKKMAIIEAVAVEVAGFVQRVEEPSDEQLKAFFEENKDQYALPGSPDAGFREPQKVALQWLKADEGKFLAMVTDAEIQERYEKNKDAYDEMEKKLEEEKAKALKEAETSAKNVKDAKPTAEKATEAEKKDGVKNKAEPKEEKKESEKVQNPEPPKKKEGSKDSSSVDRKSPFRLTALLQAEKPAGNAETKGKAVDAKPVEPSQAAATQEKPVEPPKAGATPEKPAEAPKTPAAKEKPAEKKKPGMADATKNRIRRDIAQEKMMKIFEGLREKLDQYRNEWNKYEVTLIQEQNKKEGERKTPTPPAKLDFEQLAKENGLSTGQTDLMSRWQAQSQPIGMSLAGGRSPVYTYAYQSLSKFHPELSMDMQGNFYLFWKTDETKDRVPKFEDKGVREEVLRAWKMTKARGLAMKEAESLAAEARKTRKTLKEALADRPSMQVIMPPPFSWLTFGNVPMGSAPNAARYSEVTGVEYAGEEFMRAVFHLEPNQFGVAFNEPKTMAYVIQLNEFTPSQKVLWKEFEVDDFSKYAPAAREDQYRTYQAWLDEIKTSAGLKWERKADQTQESGPREEE